MRSRKKLHSDLSRTAPESAAAGSGHLRNGGSAVAIGAALLLAVQSTAVLAATPFFVKNGKAGFVVSDFKYALAAGEEELSALCPNGTSMDVSQIFALTPEGKRRPGESDEEYGKRLEQGGRNVGKGPNGEDPCQNPELAKPDPYFRTVERSDVAVFGIDLDAAPKSSQPAACPHSDFVGPNGATGVDNQFYRLVGCSRSYLPEGQSNNFDIEMLSGSWGILFALSGIDDITNDNEVEVSIYTNADPIQLSPTREPLEYATYAAGQDPRFRATTKGRIVDGVLTTDPVDVRFHHIVNSMRMERPLRDARLQLTISAEGKLDGYLAGYTPAEELYDYQFGFRKAKDGTGAPALPLRVRSANGAARVLGYTCPGVYHALYQHADGHPDPESGQCTSISTQYMLQALPAFVVDIETKSTNEVLATQRAPRNDY